MMRALMSGVHAEQQGLSVRELDRAGILAPSRGQHVGVTGVEDEMNRSQSQHGNWQRWVMGIVMLIVMAGGQSTGQSPSGAAARPPAAQEPPLLVLSPKAKSAGWTGVHRPHTK